jgi:hypothetical protein
MGGDRAGAFCLETAAPDVRIFMGAESTSGFRAGWQEEFSKKFR